MGISAWTKRPKDAADNHPIVSGFQGGNVEKIVALQPDLVIGFSDIQAELAKKLIAAGLQVLIFNQRSLDEIGNVLLTIGRLVDKLPRARELVDAYRTRIAEIRSIPLQATPRVYFEEWPDPMICGIRWVSELIHVAGGLDVCAVEAGGAMAKERFVQPDDIASRAPDVILASWCGKPVDIDAIRNRPGWGNVPAVRHRMIFELDPCGILQPGPGCLTQGLDDIRTALTAWENARATFQVD